MKATAQPTCPNQASYTPTSTILPFAHYDAKFVLFRLRSANQVAAGAENGCVRVWTLSDALATAVTVESQEKVTELVAAAAE